MAILERIKSICLAPNLEWNAIASEPASSGGLITGYVLPLAAITAVAGFVGHSLIGVTLPFVGTYRVPIVTGLAWAVFRVVSAIVTVLLLSALINALAPSFGGEKNRSQAMKAAVYSYTPAWLAGVLQILPALSALIFIGGLYGIYLLYLGLPRLMHCAPGRSAGYTAVVVVCAVVLTMVLSGIGARITSAGMSGPGSMGLGSTLGAPHGDGPATAQFDKNSALGKLEAFGNNLEVSTAKLEAAQKSGDSNAQVAAAMESIGTILGGGKRVEPLGIEQLKVFVPGTLAGLAKKTSNASRNGVAGLTISKAQATYGDPGTRTIELEISDSGGASGLLGLAGWVGMQGESEDENGSERTRKVDGRLTHEKVSKKDGGVSEFQVVLGDRFIVSASGHGVSIDELRSAVASVDLGKLEALKEVGVSH